MASLKEIKNRINATSSTQKVTSAMRMVASANLSRVQARINTFRPYQEAYARILQALLASAPDTDSPLAATREVRHATLVALAADSGLCGAFNANILRLLDEQAGTLRQAGIGLTLIPIGKKAAEHARKTHTADNADAPCPTAHAGFDMAKALADRLMRDFLDGKTDRVMLLHNHYVNNVHQTPAAVQLLPIAFEQPGETATPDPAPDYLLEPGRDELLRRLAPDIVHNRLYLAMLDSSLAEYAARMVAMQIATDNADDLLSDLNIQYNKQRQQKITNELLDIVGGAAALE